MATIAHGKIGPTIIYASSLPASGAWGTTSTLTTDSSGYADILLQYTTGSALGAVKFYVQESPDGITFFDKTVKDVPLSGSSGFYESGLDTDVSKVPAQGNCNKSFTVAVFGAQSIRLKVAEYGVTGSAGILSASVVLKDFS